jgi:CBS domain-containing protein
MTRCPVSVQPGAPVATVAAVLSRSRIGAVPVVDRAGRLVGVVEVLDRLGHVFDDGARPRFAGSAR